MMMRLMIFNVIILKIREHIMEEVKESCLGWKCHLGIVFSFGYGAFGHLLESQGELMLNWLHLSVREAGLCSSLW